MVGRFLVENPAEVTFTLKITATAKEFEQLRDELGSRHPGWRLSSMISQMLSASRKTFYEEQEAHA